jgi:hypothetical protein
MSGLRSAASTLLITLLAVTTGCGQRLHKAGGKVLVNGKPVRDGTIQFVPADGRPATGQIKDGVFTLSTTTTDDGLPEGVYKVVIQADIWVEGKLTREQEREMAMMKKNGVNDELPTNGRLIHIVPPEYNSYDTTPLTQKVDGSTLEFVFDIKSPS